MVSRRALLRQRLAALGELRLRPPQVAEIQKKALQMNPQRLRVHQTGTQRDPEGGKTPPEQAVFRLDPTGRGKEGFQRGEDAGAVLRAEEIV